MTARIKTGTAAWADRRLVESGWYPEHVRSPEAKLRYYASRFPVVENDSTYWAFPDPDRVAGWAERSPDGFTMRKDPYDASEPCFACIEQRRRTDATRAIDQHGVSRERMRGQCLDEGSASDDPHNNFATSPSRLLSPTRPGSAAPRAPARTPRPREPSSR